MPFEHVTTPLPPALPGTKDAARIENLDDYEVATERARQLADFPEGSPEAAELASLVQAITEWDRAHDDATSWH